MTYHEKRVGKFALKIMYDTSPESPREWDNVGTMVCWHSKYKLGDEQPKEAAGDYLMDLARKHVSNAYPEGLLIANRDKIIAKHYVLLPLYLYDHSGITMNTTGFSCRWDSGQVGFIYCDLKTAIESWGGTSWDSLVKWGENTDPLRDVVTCCLKGEVKSYDDFISGEVYGFETTEYESDDEDSDDYETEVSSDSCWGFFGSDFANNGIKDHISEEYYALLP